MKAPLFVGTYRLGVWNVRLYVSRTPMDSGASFRYCPGDGGCAKLVVGGVGRIWSDVLSGLLHEALESQLHQRGAGHVRTHEARETTCDYVFFLSHNTFDQCCDFAARFVADCLPDLHKAWRRVNKER